MANGNRPVVDITVRFTAPDHIEVTPDPAKLDWRYQDRACWRLESSDEGATLHDIRFKETDANGPFGLLDRETTDPKVWNGVSCARVTGTFKYDVLVRDGSGNDIVLDPHLTLGDPPP